MWAGACRTLAFPRGAWMVGQPGRAAPCGRRSISEVDRQLQHHSAVISKQIDSFHSSFANGIQPLAPAPPARDGWSNEAQARSDVPLAALRAAPESAPLASLRGGALPPAPAEADGAGASPDACIDAALGNALNLYVETIGRRWR